MESILKNNILHICKILNKYDVQYMIIGGMAVALHGYFRQSITIDGQIADKPDIDFWYNPSYENYFKLLNALQELGIDTLEFKAETSPNPKESFFKFEDSHFTLDFLPKLIGEDKFSDLFRRVEIVNVDEVEIYFLGYEDLIAEKIKTSRLKDLKDIEELSQIKKRKS